MLSLIITVAIIGLLVWCLTELVPMDPKFKQLIIIIAIIGILIYVLKYFGVLANV